MILDSKRPMTPDERRAYDFGRAESNAEAAALRAQVASLTRERDAALANGEKAKQYWMQANEERDAAINDLTTAMVDMYIDGRGDETHICWACAYAKRDKDRYPCSSCLNYEMAEFVHRGPCADNAPSGAGEEAE